MNKPLIMGILNITPDSFFDGGSYFSFEKGVQRGIELFHEGADVLDIGGASSKPGSLPISAQEEMDRVLPVIEKLKKEIPIPLSIDSCQPDVVRRAMEYGVEWINDIDGFQNEKMLEIVSLYRPYVCSMHKKGTPFDMQLDPCYENIIEEIRAFFERTTQSLRSLGLEENKIFVDPGLGFGKDLNHNLSIIKNLEKFQKFNLVVGLSRKSFLGRLLKKTPKQLLAATLFANTICLMKGVKMIRVHDVSEHKDIIDLIDFFC
ncbi:MAG: dihydropteroate synthase [Rhabdochlamydiaceae bacterium]